MSPARVNRLMVFIKAPRPGFVKTRLAESLGAVEACVAYRRLVEQLLGRLRGLAGVELRFAPDDAEAEVRPWLNEGWSSSRQGEGDLGRRLTRAFDEAFSGSNGPVVVIGSDCPEVTAADIHSAWDALGTHDVVVGPATDGGYWLVGLRAPQADLFNGISWSTAQVCAETIHRAARAGLSVFQLRTLSDVDTLEDWQKYLARERE